MSIFISIVLWALWGVLIFLHLRIFKFPPRSVSSEQNSSRAILIPVKNDYDKIERSIRHWQKFQSEGTACILIDDHSDPDQIAKGKELAERFGLYWLPSTVPPGKMNALLFGAAHTNAGRLLLTDADCVPFSTEWPYVMDKPESDLVLGYSPYKEGKGFLNAFVRFETIITAIQYFSWATKGKAYMGVGRNMSVSRVKFLQYDPENTLYGHDDLLTQWMQKNGTVGISLHPESFVETNGPSNWKQWLAQKHRHVSAGHSYHFLNLIPPALYLISGLATWVLFGWLLITANQLGLVLWTFGLLLRALNFRHWSVRLQDMKAFRIFPFWEIFHLLILLAVSLYAILIPRKRWS